MAKKKRVEPAKEPEYEFTPPDFDEREFILKDIYSTKIAIIVAVLAVVAGFCAGAITNLWAWYGGLIVLFVVLAGMKPFLNLIKFDADLIETKTMIGNYLMYLLLGIAVWILMVNPPFV